MRRRLPWLVAASLHAGLLALLALCEPPRRDRGEASIEMEVVDVAEPAGPAADVVEEEEAPAAEDLLPERAAPRRAARRIEERAPALAPEAEPGSSGGGAMGERAETGLDLGWMLGSISDGGGDGGGGGGGGSGGAGRGGGGAGGRAARAAAPARAARRVSRARPPRLVYPRRFRDERGGEVFVALLTVDEDGWVVGVRLVQGVNPHADQRALDAVWRFHYDPALDPAGRPIRARVTQRFMVE